MGRPVDPVDAPEPPPAPMAGFVMLLSAREGAAEWTAHLDELSPTAARFIHLPRVARRDSIGKTWQPRMCGSRRRARAG